LRNLPGIGRYTAGAIASIAFGLDEPALDGNIKRVYARLFDVTLPVNTSRGESALWKIARDNLPIGKAGEFNQALMDLGALVCTPRNPNCSQCPLREGCLSFQRHSQNERPVLKAKKPIPHHIQATAVIVQNDRVLLAQRPEDGLLGGMWEFPGCRIQPDGNGFEHGIKNEYNLTIRKLKALKEVQHAYTHFKVTVRPFLCELISGDEQVDQSWVKRDQLADLPMGKVDRTIAKQLQNSME
jgi:A/G-specific adenine glycosylase